VNGRGSYSLDKIGNHEKTCKKRILQPFAVNARKRVKRNLPSPLIKGVDNDTTIPPFLDQTRGSFRPKVTASKKCR